MEKISIEHLHLTQTLYAQLDLVSQSPVTEQIAQYSDSAMK